MEVSLWHYKGIDNKPKPYVTHYDISILADFDI
jgi:hypothetical protein